MNEVYLILLGDFAQAVLFLIGGYTMFVRNETQQRLYTDELRTDMGDMRDELKKLSDVITIQAVQTTRIDNLTALLTSIERRVEDMRRGAGFIMKDGREHS